MTEQKQLTFSREDADFMEAFGKFIAQKARMDLTVPEVIQFHKYLVQYNQLTRKIDSHIMELIRVVEPEPTSEQKKGGKK